MKDYRGHVEPPTAPESVGAHLRELRKYESIDENQQAWSSLRATRAWDFCAQYQHAAWLMRGRTGSNNIRQQISMRATWVIATPQLSWSLLRYRRTALARWVKQLRKKVRT